MISVSVVFGKQPVATVTLHTIYELFVMFLHRIGSKRSEGWLVFNATVRQAFTVSKTTAPVKVEYFVY